MAEYTKASFFGDICMVKVNIIEELLNFSRVLSFKIKNKVEVKLKLFMVNIKDNFKMDSCLVLGYLNGMEIIKRYTRDILGKERCMVKAL